MLSQIPGLNNPLLDTDSYKLCHASMYDIMGVEATESYIEPRSHGDEILFVGLSIWTKTFPRITHAMVDEAREFFSLHIRDGEKLFPEKAWRRVVDEFGGYPPITIRALHEGTVIPSRNALAVVECDVSGLAWMGPYFETSILRAAWYTTTVASKSYSIRKLLRERLAITSDLDPVTGTNFMYHDFGARGVSSQESAAYGGAAHILAGSDGTDTISGALTVNAIYSSRMSAFSVFATEHSIMTMRGREGELQTVRDLIKTFNTSQGTIISIVSDGYSIRDLVERYCTTLKDEILEAGIALVIRPDSGDPAEIVVSILNRVAEAYGYVVNSKGYKVLNVVRVLQGDGMSTKADVAKLLDAVQEAGFSVENIVIGQGGGLLQMVNRDDYKFAMKTCAALINGKWVDVFKDPITDIGKRSKRGRLVVVKRDGEFATITKAEMLPGETDLLIPVWSRGKVLKDYTLPEVRNYTTW